MIVASRSLAGVVPPAALSLLVALGAASSVRAQEHPLPPPRAIPGLTAEDPFPGGCVDCHVADPARNLDVRFSTLFRRWREQPDTVFLRRMQALAPEGVTLTGAHPKAEASLAKVPGGCVRCHEEDSEKAPPLGAMVHTLHLTGGAQNVFLTEFQGQCTFCHKFDAESGTWTMTSGPERRPEGGS